MLLNKDKTNTLLFQNDSENITPTNVRLIEKLFQVKAQLIFWEYN